jgi:hypothetical protein
LDCPNFTKNAPGEKIVEAIKIIQKSRELNLHKRDEITGALRGMALDHNALSMLQPQSYVTSLIHATAKMKIDDA